MEKKEDLYFLLKLIGDAIETKANNQLKHYDMTLSQGRVLAYLYERRGEKTAQRELEDYFQVSHPTINGILKRLESKGYVQSEVDDLDKRVKNVYLSPDYLGKSLKATALQKEMEAIMTKGIPKNQVEEFRGMLYQMLVNLETR